MELKKLMEHISIIPDYRQAQGKFIRSSLFVLNNSHFMFKN